MSTRDLLAARMKQLEKRTADLEAAAEALAHTRLQSKHQFEKRFSARLTSTICAPGSLVLVRNNTIEKSHNRKHKLRYNGPYEVFRITAKGLYVLQELDGTIMRQGVSPNRVIPYLTRNDPRIRQLVSTAGPSDSEEASATPSNEDLEY